MYKLKYIFSKIIHTLSFTYSGIVISLALKITSLWMILGQIFQQVLWSA